MVDKDGVERPDDLNAHTHEIKQDKRKKKIDGTYDFYPRNLFFHLWAAIFRVITICVFNPFTLFKYRVKIIGKKNLKRLKRKPFIITCSHVHFLDDVCVGTNIFPSRKMYFTTLESNIRRPIVGFFLRSLGGMPIPTGSIDGMRKFNNDISLILKKKKPVMFNPEGSLWKYYREVRPFKKGAFAAAVNNDVPILPILVTFKRKKKRNGNYKYLFYYTIGEQIEINKEIKSVKEQVNAMQQTTYDWYVHKNKEWYESQDCGF